MKDCASKGSIVHPIKNKNVHDFLTALVPATIAFDIWIGLRNQKHIQIFDPDQEFNPLQEFKIAQMTYSDHEMFDKEKDYLYGERKLAEGDCFFLKQQSDFEGKNNLRVPII